MGNMITYSKFYLDVISDIFSISSRIETALHPPNATLYYNLMQRCQALSAISNSIILHKIEK
jgi:hypothetical protein